jgi:SAM-dependent methyltransferase
VTTSCSYNPFPLTFPDHFSAQAADYGRYRPTYPVPLFEWLASAAPARRLVWDCATGNGQAAIGLAPHFESVLATDASENQLSHAAQHPRIAYRLAQAEASGLPDGCADLVTVAQALHWFHFDSFYEEVRRVLAPGGVFAAWTYVLFSVEPRFDVIVRRLWSDTLKDDWPPERRYVDEEYRTLPFPFEPIAAPPFLMEAWWSLEEVVGYLRTWSAIRRFVARVGHDPLEVVSDEMMRAWGDPEEKRLMRWPLILKVGRVA